MGLYSLAIRLDALHGYYGVQKRKDGNKGSIFWFEIPYRPDEYNATSMHHLNTIHSSSYSHRCDSEQSSIHCPVNIQPSLPLVSETFQDSSSSSVKEQEHDKLHNLNILVVDDSPTIAKMISMMLQQHGHKVTVAENGEIAVQKLFSHWKDHQIDYDIVLMDLQMPVMDGLEATKRLRENEMMSSASKHKKHQIIIGMSANSDHETMQDAFRAGVDDFITKPFRIDWFHQTASRLIFKQ